MDKHAHGLHGGHNEYKTCIFSPMTPPPRPSHPGISARHTGHLHHEGTSHAIRPRSDQRYSPRRRGPVHRDDHISSDGRLDCCKEALSAAYMSTRSQGCVGRRGETDGTRICRERLCGRHGGRSGPRGRHPRRGSRLVTHDDWGVRFRGCDYRIVRVGEFNGNG